MLPLMDRRLAHISGLAVRAAAALFVALSPTLTAYSSMTSFEQRMALGSAAEQRVQKGLAGKERTTALREAADHYTYVIDKTNDDKLKAKALERRAVMLYALRDCAGAVRDATRVVQYSPTISAEMHKIRGHCYSVERRYGDAITEYGRAITLGETDPEIYRSRGDAYVALGNDQKAVMDFSTYLERHPQMDVFEARGDAYVRMGQYAAGRKDYELALNKAFEADRELRRGHVGDAWPGLVHYKSKIGQTFLWEGNAARARELYRELINASPDSYEGYLGIAEVELMEEDRRRAATALEMASKAVSLSRGRDPDALAALAEAVFRTGDAKNAMSVIERALKLRQHDQRLLALQKKYANGVKGTKRRGNEGTIE